MTANRCRTGDRCESATSRRQFLAATAAATAAGMAGCTEGLTTYEFEADFVGLEGDARDELALAEIERDRLVETREPSVGDVEGEVTITSHTVAYQRGPARGQPTLLEAFIGRTNGTSGPGAAKVVTGTHAGIDEVTLDFLEEAPTVGGDQFCLTVPAGARNDGAVTADETMAMMHASDVPGDGLLPDPRWLPGPRWIESREWFPDREWLSGDQWIPDPRWIEGSHWVPDDPTDLHVLIVQGGPLADWNELFGRSAEEVGGRPLEEGEEIPAANTLFAIPGSHLAPSDKPDWDPADLFDAGVPAPTGGATFGTSVLSTPRAEVAGEVQNPFAREDLETLIRSDRARDVLKWAGLSDAENVRWLGRPVTYDEVASTGGQNPFVMLDQETELESFVGVVSGRDGPWGVGLHVARVQNGDDAVIAAGGHRTPVGTADLEGADYAFDFENPHDVAWFERAAELTAATLGRLAVRRDQM